MAKRRLPQVKVSKARKSTPDLPSPYQPRIAGDDDTELLVGQVQGMKASAPEERLVTELEQHKSVTRVQFRYTIGAPRGLPGWKELDALVSSFGLMYAIEVDTAFTHRDKKAAADTLHDAIILNDLRKQGLNVFPKVIHLDGESDLVDKASTKQTVTRIFG